ncbi:hypothetical protein N9442_00205 [Gammaproteobacteria bacterium]|jgi:hypothetical protein|nr:hypothetical protein [Gammaproteobacteria bacterium]MDC3323477.1 hypothetical protein [Gammaproteobacteria bacterium]|tara:strand:- start:544 stop:927 length:384 start_codon:yes stop_codon:yes gene_type:complete
MTIKKFRTLYFIYNADGGLLNEIKYWINKNLLNKQNTCELCDISHSKIFVRSDWLQFIKELKKDYKVEVLHRNEVPNKIIEKNYVFPCVIGETENDLIEIINSISFSGFRKTEGMKELREKLHKKAI